MIPTSKQIVEWGLEAKAGISYGDDVVPVLVYELCGDEIDQAVAWMTDMRTAVDAAEDERSKLRDAIGVDVSLEDGLSWVVDSIKKLKAERDKALAEAAGYQKLAQACKDEDGKTVVVIIQGESEVRVFGPNSDCEERFGEVVVRWWKLLDTVAESKAFDALKAERDKLAESERSWQELASARGAALKALVEASGALIEGIDEFSSDCTTRYETCLEDLDGLRDALAAAKVQP